MTIFANGVLNFFLAIILPVQVYLLLIGGVIILDTHFGILKSRKQKLSFSLHSMLKGMSKKIAIYTPAMLGVYWLDQHLLNEFVLLFINIDGAITKLGCAILISTELASINDNLKVITGSSFIARMRSVFKMVKTFKTESKDVLPPDA